MRSDETLTNTNLGWDVEAVSLLSIELGGVEDDGDLPLEHHEHHRVLVCAGHALSRVSLDPEEGKEVVWRPEGPGVLHCVGGHAIPLLADVDPPDIIKIVKST